MKNKSKQILLVLSILAIAVVVLFILINSKQHTINVNKNGVAKTTPAPSMKPFILNKVTLTKTGFEPKNITIKKGEAVIWNNQSREDASINSADHPTHKRYPFLNLGLFKPNGNIQTQFNTDGTFQYHNHYNPAQTGTVIVK